MNSAFCGVAAQVLPVLLLIMILRGSAWNLMVRDYLTKRRDLDKLFGALMVSSTVALVAVEGMFLIGASRATGLGTEASYIGWVGLALGLFGTMFVVTAEVLGGIPDEEWAKRPLRPPGE